METENRPPRVAVVALLTGAFVWGLIWYPYRVLGELGVAGIVGTMATYATAFLLGLFFFRRALRTFVPRWSLFWLALAAGGCNLGYVLGTMQGEVVRVLLLFYLAPLWTVLLSRCLLGERLNRFGVFVVALSLGGAFTILWHPAVGWPLPRDNADWLGLGAGICFALLTVVSRYASDVAIEVKSMVSFSGVLIVGSGLLLAGISPAVFPVGSSVWLLIGLIGSILIVVNFVVQFGLGQVAANRAIVIMLTEVGFAALASWLLAGESFGLRESVGGAMIIAASVFSAKMEAKCCT